MAIAIDPDTTLGTVEVVGHPVARVAASLPPVEERRRELRRRGRAARLRRWLSAVSVGGVALALVTVTLFSLIGH